MSVQACAKRTVLSTVWLALVVVACGAENPALKDEDPLPVDSSWKGKFTQMGTHPDVSFPPELEATLTVVGRDGDNVEIELRESMPGLDVTFLCQGRIRRNADQSLALEFKSHGVKGVPNVGFYLINVPYTARIAGDTIKGSWKYVDKDEGIDLGGDYALTRE